MWCTLFFLCQLIGVDIFTTACLCLPRSQEPSCTLPFPRKRGKGFVNVILAVLSPLSSCTCQTSGQPAEQHRKADGQDITVLPADQQRVARCRQHKGRRRAAHAKGQLLACAALRRGKAARCRRNCPENSCRDSLSRFWNLSTDDQLCAQQGQYHSGGPADADAQQQIYDWPTAFFRPVSSRLDSFQESHFLSVQPMLSPVNSCVQAEKSRQRL